jgi:hypothetical protein
MLELGENSVVLARIKLSLFLCFEHLKLKEELDKFIIALNVSLKVEVKSGFNAFEALSEFAHGCIMDRVASEWHILRHQYLSHPHKQVSRILLKE